MKLTSEARPSESARLPVTRSTRVGGAITASMGVLTPIVGLVGIAALAAFLSKSRSAPPAAAGLTAEAPTARRCPVAERRTPRPVPRPRHDRKKSETSSRRPTLERAQASSLLAVQRGEGASARWAREANDAAWTENMVGYLASVGFSVDAGTNAIGEVDCRETTCRFIANVGQVEIL